MKILNPMTMLISNAEAKENDFMSSFGVCVIGKNQSPKCPAVRT